jgi:histidine triad (HIT) family protein
MSDCLFCKMAKGDIKPNIVFENDSFLAFNDINPQAPIHVLIIPKQHYANLNELDNAQLAGELLITVATIAKQLGVAENGYRTVINCNNDGGQTVYHLHIHLLAGRQLTWPAG